jgi:hypothetical protein
MFLGEFACLVVFRIQMCRERRDGKVVSENHHRDPPTPTPTDMIIMI